MEPPLPSSIPQSRQTRQQFANPDAYLSYELGKAVQAPPPLYARLVAVSLSFAVFGAIAWAALSKVDDVAVARGELIPSEQVQPVRSLDSGIIQAIKVEEGQQVQKGDTLVELDSEQSQAEVNRQAAVIKAAKIELARLQTNLGNARTSLNSALEREQSLRRLAASSAIPRMDYLDAQDRVTEARDRVASLEKEIATQKQNIYQAEQAYQRARSQQETATIKAPIAGRVYNIKATIGQGTVQAGQELLSIVPEGRELLLEVNLPNQYRGLVDEGMAVKVKIDAFPYQDFGTVDGTVTYISPNEVSQDSNSEQKHKVYLTRVQLNQSSADAVVQDKKLAPGMEATGEIVMRQKSVLSYLIEPITRKFGEVFQRR